MGTGPFPNRPTVSRPSDVGPPSPTEAQVRVEALKIAMTLPDAHSAGAVLENAKTLRDWIMAGRG